MRKRFARGPHFLSHLGMNLVMARKGLAQVQMAVTASHMNVFGAVHGGAVFSLVDTAMGAALVGFLEEKETMATVEAKINYIRPVVSGSITAEAAVLHRGQHTAVLEASVTTSDGVVVAHALGTYLILTPDASGRDG